jgi:methyltransferase (TIGR00027 family)
VSDTAYWVANYRAEEGRRPHAAFNDHLADVLAGGRGNAIAESIPRAALVEWGMVIRTSAIDRVIGKLIDIGVDSVINLGAGLDTRPYRLSLPPHLRWSEVDFPCIIEWKNSMLVEHMPTCHLDRVSVDLLDRTARNAFLARCLTNAKSAAVITEGVLSYFSVQDVATLASDLRALPAIRFWIQDFDNAGARSLPKAWDEKLKEAPLLFNVEDWFEFFAAYGWHPYKVITSLEESQRLNRPYPLDWPAGLLLRVLPKSMRQQILRMSGAVVMRAASEAPCST